MNWFLNVHYALVYYDRASADALITGAVGDRPSDSGAGFGIRDISFCYATKDEAERAKKKLEAAGLPLALEVDVDDIP